MNCNKYLLYAGLFVLLGITNVATSLSQDRYGAPVDDFGYLYYKGTDHFDNLRYNVALTYFQRANMLEPHNIGIAMYSGLSCKEMNQYASTISYFKDAIEYSDNSHIAIGNLGAIYAEMGEDKEALLYLNNSLDIKPDYGNALNNKGALLLGQGEYDEALRLLHQAMEYAPNLVDAPYNIAVIYQETNQPDSAIVYFDKILTRLPKYNKALLGKAAELDKIGEKTDDFETLCNGVIASHTAIINKNPLAYRSYMARASAYKLLGKEELMAADLHKALPILNELVELHPQAYNIVANRASVHKKLGNKDAAIKDNKRVLELNPKSPIALKYIEQNS